jgi:hypothetical protein
MSEVIGPLQDKKAEIVPPLDEQVREYIRASKAESTLRGYRADWRHFCQWCQEHHLCPLPASPEAVAAYIAECAERLKVGSIQRRLNAIAEAHKDVGVETPTASGMVRNTLKGIRRTKGTAPMQKAATLTDDIRAMVEATDAGLIGTRDRALILLGCVPPLGAGRPRCGGPCLQPGRTVSHAAPEQNRSGGPGPQDRHPRCRHSENVTDPTLPLTVRTRAVPWSSRL